MDNFFGEKLSEEQCDALSSLSLAFIGDAVWTLIVRQYFCDRTTLKNNNLHRLSTRLVKATFQAQAYNEIEERLTPREKDIARRSRNVKLNTIAKNATVAEYRKATSFEAVIGYLYLIGNMERIEEITIWLQKHFDEVLQTRLVNIK